MTARHILLVEPGRDAADEIAHQLGQDGHTVVIRSSGAEALAELARGDVALVITEQSLPDMTGIDLVRRVRGDRRGTRVPMVITDGRGEEIDRVVAFELGVDDYLVKPFSVRELGLRVRAILRRVHGADDSPKLDVVTVGPVTVDRARHRATVGDREISLTRRELELLLHLASDPGRVHTRAALLESVWRNSTLDGSRAVDTAVKRLRHKLGTAGDWIETVRGVGYRVRHPARPMLDRRRSGPI